MSSSKHSFLISQRAALIFFYHYFLLDAWQEHLIALTKLTGVSIVLWKNCIPRPDKYEWCLMTTIMSIYRVSTGFVFVCKDLSNLFLAALHPNYKEPVNITYNYLKACIQVLWTYWSNRLQVNGSLPLLIQNFTGSFSKTALQIRHRAFHLQGCLISVLSNSSVLAVSLLSLQKHH